METVTVTTASLGLQQRGGGGTERGGGGERRKTRREGETKRRTGGRGGLGPPDLDLDAVEEEAREEEEEEEEERRRSQTVRQKGTRENQREHGRRSRSLPRISARSWDAMLPPEGVEVEEEAEERRRRAETKSKRRVTAANREGEGRRERDDSTARRAKHSGSSGTPQHQKAMFSFLMPKDDESEFDSESAASFSEVSQSAASVATAAGWREDSDWRRAESPWQQGNAPGPWLKPSPQKLTKVLIGCRLGGREALSL